jgi:hypothetical protein
MSLYDSARKEITFFVAVLPIEKRFLLLLSSSKCQLRRIEEDKEPN